MILSKQDQIKHKDKITTKDQVKLRDNPSI